MAKYSLSASEYNVLPFVHLGPNYSLLHSVQEKNNWLKPTLLYTYFHHFRNVLERADVCALQAFSYLRWRWTYHTL